MIIAWAAFFVAWAAVIVASEAFFVAWEDLVVASEDLVVASEAAHGDFCDRISDFFDPDGIRRQVLLQNIAAGQTMLVF